MAAYSWILMMRLELGVGQRLYCYRNAPSTADLARATVNSSLLLINLGFC
jgi:hypothetical protein